MEIFRDVPADQTAERHFGKDLLAGVRHRMLQERSWDVYPKSEPSAEFRKRAINAVEAAIASHRGERIAIVCHAGVINAYAGHLVGSPYDMFFRPGHTSISVVAAGNGRRVLHSLNDMQHLHGRGAVPLVLGRGLECRQPAQLVRVHDDPDRL